jgi:hypothetical protein
MTQKMMELAGKNNILGHPPPDISSLKKTLLSRLE